MEVGSTRKVRCVRCPKCWQLLPEPTGVLVYKCGGCSTVLQVKSRKSDAKSHNAGLPGSTEAAQMNELDQKASLPSSDEHPLDQNIERDQDISSDCTGEKFRGVNSSNEEHNDGSYHNESQDCNVDQPGVSDVFFSSTELAHCGNEDASQSAEANSAVDNSNESDPVSRSSVTETTEVVARKSNSIVTYHRPAGENVSSDVLEYSHDEQPKQLPANLKHGYDRVRSNDAFGADSEVEKNGESSQLVEAKPEVDINNESDSTSRSSNPENAVVTRENNSSITSHRPAGESVSSDILISSPDEQPEQLPTNLKHDYDCVRSNDAFGADIEVEVNDQSSQLVEAKSVVDVNNESNSTFRSLNTENTVVTTPVTSLRPAGEIVSSDILISSPEEQPKQLGISFKPGYDRVRSNDTFETSFFSPRSELSGTIDYMHKSPTIRSSHAYDGSVSSFDEMDDQVSDRHISAYKNPNKFVSYEDSSRRDKFLVNGNPEMWCQARNLSSVLSDKRLYAMNHRKWDRDELRESAGHGHYQGDYLAGYESGSTSSQLHDEFHYHSSEQEKIKLLRMVYELQDQLNRTDYLNEKASHLGSSEVTAKEKYVPAYYSREASEEEFSHKLNYNRYPGRYRQGRSNWSHQYKYSHMPWQCSTRSRGFCRFHPGHSYCSHRSCPSSPQQFTDSEFSICHRETKSDYQGHEDYHVKRHMKEQPHLINRHLRPTAGGAPFIICYRCLKPLQLPADFLIFKRRFHQLRCGACSEVLKFSLENRIHIVPYKAEAEAEAPRRSEVVVDYLDAVNRRNLSSSHGNEYPQADPVSCSDDSYCKSYSTDGDPVFLASLHNIQGNADARNMSYDSAESMKEGNRFVPKQSQNKNKNPEVTFKSAGTSFHKSRSGKVISEIKELPGKTTSALHWLMGYNSPSQVIRGSEEVNRTS